MTSGTFHPVVEHYVARFLPFCDKVAFLPGSEDMFPISTRDPGVGSGSLLFLPCAELFPVL